VSGTRDGRRWRVLGAYILVLAVSQMLWLNFAPLISLIERRYSVSALTAGLLILVFPLLYIAASLPAGALTDARGYRASVGCGAIVMAAFSCLRVFDQRFAFLLAGQIGIALAQPFVVNGISKLGADWFDEEQAVLATGLGTMGMFLGMAIGMAATPALVEAAGFRATMIVCAAVTVVATIVFAIVVHPNPRAAPTPPGPVAGFGPLLKSRDQLIFYAISFLGIGVFNGLTTWLEPILAPQGIEPRRAGLVGGTLIIGGIVGAVVIPALSERLRRRRPLLIVCAAGSVVTLYPLCTLRSYPLVLAAAALHGFFLMPAVALLLDMCAETAGARRAGASTALLMLAGNLGGVMVAVALPLVSGARNDQHAAVLLLAVSLVLATQVPETSRRAGLDAAPSSAGPTP
jgi:predicted MFS family arabinose efflux permease